MTHIYKVTGMTCGGCEATVKSSLLMLPNVTGAEVSKEKQTATISMDKHIVLSTFQSTLNKKYSITEIEPNGTAENANSWLVTYKPILMIFAYVTTVAIFGAARQSNFDWMQGMNVFMAGFFLTFSFFKMLDLKGFADSYTMYDIVAKKVGAWGLLYPFIELGLGLAYATNFHPLVTNMVTLTVMSVSMIGLLQSVLSKRKIKCACLGAVFNLPMSTVTIIEDALMIGMSGLMLLMI